jgi:hypothetical protein
MKRRLPAWTALVVAMAVPMWLLSTPAAGQAKGVSGGGAASSGGSSSGGSHASGGGGGQSSGGGGGHASSGGGSHAGGGGQSSGGGARASSGGGGHVSGGGARTGSAGPSRVSGGGSTASPRGGAQRGPGNSTSGATANGNGRTGAGSDTAVQRGSQQSGGNNVVPPYARPRGDLPPTGQAVPRSSIPAAGGGSVVIIPGYYGGGFYPWGYAGLGFAGGYGYYGGYYEPGYDMDPYAPQYQAGGRDDSGGLKLKVKPSDATVYVDGYYVGAVNDFDGVFQKLTIEPGAHRVEIRAPGYETLQMDVRVEPGRTSTYRGDLKKLQN